MVVYQISPGYVTTRKVFVHYAVVSPVKCSTFRQNAQSPPQKVTLMLVIQHGITTTCTS